jgi:hypothetical protein
MVNPELADLTYRGHAKHSRHEAPDNAPKRGKNGVDALPMRTRADPGVAEERSDKAG